MSIFKGRTRGKDYSEPRLILSRLVLEKLPFIRMMYKLIIYICTYLCRGADGIASDRELMLQTAMPTEQESDVND